MIGQLFTQDFLKTGIADTPVWQGITDAELDAFIADLKTIYAPYKAGSNLNEPMTENEILVRVLVKLGWTDILTQQIASKTRREDVPDMLPQVQPACKTGSAEVCGRFLHVGAVDSGCKRRRLPLFLHGLHSHFSEVLGGPHQSGGHNQPSNLVASQERKVHRLLARDPCTF